MKITCERCRAEYDVPDAKIPPSGFKMTCPACNNEIKVDKSAAAAAPPAPREIALSSLDDDAVDLPPPTLSAPSAPAPPSISEAALGDTDFSQLSSGPPSLALADEPELPAPVAKKPLPPLRPPGAKPAAPTEQEVVDLPAPRTAGSAPRTAADGGVDLPTPKAARPPLPPSARPGGAKPPPPPPAAGPDVVDLPGPIADLPKPRAPRIPAAQSGPPSTGDDGAIPLDLDSPDIDDEPGSVDLPTPKADSGLDLPAPRADGSIDLPAPRADHTTDLPTPRPERPRPIADAAPRDAQPIADDGDTGAPPGRRRVLIAAGAVVVVAVGVAVALNVLGTGGAARRELELKLGAARKAIADDSSAALRKAAADLKPFSSAEKPSDDALTVEAQARLVLARLGATTELGAAKALLERPTEAAPSPDRKRADALRPVVTGDVGAARKALKEILASTPADAAALVYLGWAELLARDLPAAQGAFDRAAAAEPTRAQARYGIGQVKERLGDDAAAKAAYDKVVAAVPDHARARLGLLRIAIRAGEPEAAVKLESFVAEHAATIAPREQAEGLVALGTVALAAGRRDEAEDRFKKALTLDPDPKTSLVSSDARLGLARVLIDGGHGAQAIDDLRKVLAIDGRGLEVRVLLTEALLDKQETKEAEAYLAAAEKISPKDGRIAFLRGRLLIAHTTVSPAEREQAIARFREATAADPKLLAAWAALARNLNELGRTAEAVEALDKAAAALTNDPRGAAILGSAYLAIGRPADAETRFRAVLANGEGKGDERLPLWMGLGDALEAQGKLADAQAAYADAQKIAPKSAALLERRGRLAFKTNKLDEARGFFDEAIKLGTPTVGLRLAAAELALKTGRAPDARKLVETVMQDDDRSALACLYMAKIEAQSGRAEEAVSLARRAATLQDLPEAHLLLGELLESTNKLDAAAAELGLARRGPTMAAATLGHARVLVKKGATKDALDELLPLAKAGDLRAEALLLAGDCYTDLQQADKARHAFEDAAKLAPTSGEAAFKLGRAELDAGKRQPALAALERAIKLGDAKATWMPDAYLLVGDARRQGKENEAAIRAYLKYLSIAPPTAPMRGEASRQVKLLGGTPPETP